MKMVCAVVANRIATLEHGDPLPLGLDAHATSCLRCQAVQARDRRMRRALSGLALHTVSAPAGLVAAVDDAIAPALEAPQFDVRFYEVKPGMSELRVRDLLTELFAPQTLH